MIWNYLESGTRFSPIWSRQDLTLPYLQNDACGGFFLHKCHLGCLFGLFFYLEEWLAAQPSLFLLVGICGMTTVPYTIEWSSCLAADQLPKLGYLPQLLPMPFIMGKQMPSPLIPIWKREPLPIFRIVFYRQYYKNVFESYGLAFETYWIPLHEDNSEAAFDPLVLLKVSLKIGHERTSNMVSTLKRPLDLQVMSNTNRIVVRTHVAHICFTTFLGRCWGSFLCLIGFRIDWSFLWWRRSESID